MLPKAQTTETTKKNHITLSVTEDKHYFLDKKEVAFEDLKSSLQKITSERNDKTVIVRIPHDLQVQDLVNVLQIGSDLKLNFSIATAK
jgi:biopolymer transport protein ExbD